MASSRRTYDTDVITLRTVFAKNPGNSNVPALRVLTADGQGGTYWAVPSSLGVYPSFNQIITTGGTYTADLSFNTFRLTAGENIGMVDGSPGSNETTVYAKAFSQFDISGENTLYSFRNNVLDSSVTFAGQGGITLRGDPATNTMFIVGPASNNYTVSTGIYGFNQIKVTEAASTLTASTIGWGGTFFTATSPSTLLRFIGYNDIQLSSMTTTNTLFFTISTFTSKGYLDISANAYGAFPSTLSTVSSLYVQIPVFTSTIESYSTIDSSNYSTVLSTVNGIALSTGFEFDVLTGLINARATIVQLNSEISNVNVNIQSTSIGLGTLGFISTGSGAVVGTEQLLSTVEGLGTIGYISSVGGVIGDVTTANLASTVEGLGTAGYFSSLSTIITSTIFNTGAISTYSLEVFGPATFTNSGSTILRGPIYMAGPVYVADSFTGASNSVVTPQNLNSTLAGLGTARYISSAGLQSTVRGLGSASYISSSQLISSIAGLATAGYLSSLRGTTVSTGNVFASSLNLLDVYTNDVNFITVSSGSLLVNGAKISGGGGGGGNVAQIVAGTGISVNPAGGTGVVTITNTGATTTYVDTQISSFSTALGFVGGGGASYNFSTVSSVYGSSFVTTSLFASTLNTVNILPSQSNLWVATGFGSSAVNNIQYSGDGRNWSNVNSGGFSQKGRGIAYNGSLWIAVGNNGDSTGSIQYSRDGKNWSNAAGGFSTEACGIAYNGSLWVAVGNNGGDQATSIQYSSDGINWSGIATGGFSVKGESVAWNGSYWVATGQGGNAQESIQYSLNGVVWTYATTGGFATSGKGIAWNGSLWVAAGDDTTRPASLQYSRDGQNWSNATSGGFLSAAWRVAWNGNLWVAVGDESTILKSIQYSVDGSNWNDIQSGGFTDGSDGYGIGWNGFYWVAVGSGATSADSIQYSVDGRNWSSASTGGFANGGFGIAFSSNLAAGYSQQGLSILSQNIPLFLTSTNQIFAKPSSLFINNTVAIDGQYKYVGINCNLPAYTLDVAGTGHFTTVSTLAVYLSSINGAPALGTDLLVSTVAGLGNSQYVSTSGLVSTTLGLQQSGFLSTPVIISTTRGLQQSGFLSTPVLTSTTAGLTASLVSTVGGMGQNYFSTASMVSTGIGINTNLISTVAGIGQNYFSTLSMQSTIGGLGQNYFSTASMVSTGIGINSNLASTVGGIGQNYFSTLSMQSTIGGLGQNYFSTASMVSTGIGINSNLASTVGGIGQNYFSTLSMQSTIGGLGQNYFSTLSMQSTIGGIGRNYFSTLSMQSTIGGLGQNYFSTASMVSTGIGINSNFASTVGGIGQNYFSTLSMQSTIGGIGQNYFSSLSMQSTIGGIGRNYFSTLSMQSTIGGIGQNYFSTASMVSTGTGTRDIIMSTVNGLVWAGNIASNANNFGYILTTQLTSTVAQLGSGAGGGGGTSLAVSTGTFNTSTATSLFMLPSTSYVYLNGCTSGGNSIMYSFNNTLSAIPPSSWTFATQQVVTASNLREFNGVSPFAYNPINRMWVAAATIYTGGTSNGTIQYSYDAINWTPTTGHGFTISFGNGGYGVAYGLGARIWVAVGTDATNSIAFSYNGINWTGVGSQFTTRGRVVAWNGRMFVAGGEGGTVLRYSFNGVAWAAGTGTAISVVLGLAWNGRIWIAVGTGATQIQFSTDGIAWTSVSYTLTNQIRAIAWNGYMWLAGGQNGTAPNTGNVIYSYDGINWAVSTGAAFTFRCDSLLWNGKIWMVWGGDYQPAFPSIPGASAYYSRDGINWTLDFAYGGVSPFNIFFTNVATPSYSQDNFAILPIMAPLYQTSTNTMSFTPSSIVLNNTLSVDGFYNFVGINNTNPSNTLDVAGSIRASTMSSIMMFSGRGLMSSLMIGTPASALSTSAFRLTITHDSAVKPGTASWTSASDQRVKENIMDADFARCYDDIKALRLRRFQWAQEFFQSWDGTDRNVLGFIAQEVSSIVPKTVAIREGYGYPDFHFLNVDQLNMSLYGAVKKTITDKESMESTIKGQQFTIETLMGTQAIVLSTLEGLQGR